ncbi:MAG: KAP family NTPase [Desulfobacteraceae bacterium]|nr:KAP family NTPase [Desulfobacteraceae bacterium]
MWSDNETTLDLLGFRVHADLIRSVVLNRKLLPVTIGVFGDWGGGKTSIMKMLETDLDPENYTDPDEKAKYENIACLYFNGWLFEGYDDAKSAIISSVLLQLGEHKRFGPKIRDNVVSLIKSINWMRVVRLGLKEVALPAVAAYVSGGASIVPSLVKSTAGLIGCLKDESTDEVEESSGDKSDDTEGVNWEELIKSDKTPASPLDVRSFRERFAKMIDDSDIQCLVIMVDDLDRCSPERIIENLEAIKLFLNVNKTAFVIGADPRIVRNAIAVTYSPDKMRGQEEEGEAPDSLITDYLEKLIQVPYRLPRLSPAEVETYMTLLFCQRELEQDLFSKCVTKCEEAREKNRYSVFGYADVEKAIGNENLPDNLAQSLIFCSHASPLITEGLKGNPRQIKRFLNALMLRKELASVAKLSNIRDDVLVKLMVLEYAHLKEFLKLFNWQQSQDGFPEQIKEWEKSIKEVEGDIDKLESDKITEKRWDIKSMRCWLAMEPSLSDIDLRDYFWIARDRLESTLSGTALISPIVRLALSDIISGNSGKVNQALHTVKEFEEDERVSFLDLLETHIKRHADEKSGYDAFRELINTDIPGSVESYLNVLLTVPINAIPVAIAFDMAGLLKGRHDLGEKFEPVIERLSSKKSKINTALQKALQLTKKDK